ncbi:MAG TPA: hypothetical protein PLI95_26050 [Polyangiaceae bacterium]|nr:hypothetical protein [Polyangiaceae bacterium]
MKSPDLPDTGKAFGGVECPSGSKWDGSKCAASVDASCASGMHFEAGVRGERRSGSTSACSYGLCQGNGSDSCGRVHDGVE